MLTAPEPTTFPRLLDTYPPSAASLLDTLSARIAAEPFNAVASAIFGLAILHTFAAARFTALAHRRPAPPRRAAAAARPSRGAQRPCRSAPFPRRGRSRLRLVGDRAARRDHVLCRLAHGRGLLQRHRQLHRAAVRDRDHGARVDAPDHPAGRGRAARAGARGEGDPGGVVGDHPDRRSAVRLAHHRARGDDDLRPPPRPAVLRPAAVGAAEVRDARPAVRQRVDRRHADPLRGAAGADGGAAVELGHAVHARALRLAGRRGDRRVGRRLRADLPAGAGRARRAARSAGRRGAGGGRRERGTRCCCRCRPGSPSSMSSSWAGRSSRRTIRRCSSAGS